MNLHTSDTTPTSIFPSLLFLYNLLPHTSLVPTLQNHSTSLSTIFFPLTPSLCGKYHPLYYRLNLFYPVASNWSVWEYTSYSKLKCLICVLSYNRDDGWKGRFGFESKLEVVPSDQYPKSSPSESHVVFYLFLFSFWLRSSESTLLERGFHLLGYVYCLISSPLIFTLHGLVVFQI